MINFIFDEDSLWFVVALIAVMVVFGALQAGARAKQAPDAMGTRLLALALAAAATLGLVIALGVVEPEPRYLVPVGGMVVGNSMIAAAVALTGSATRSPGTPARSRRPGCCATSTRRGADRPPQPGVSG